MSNKNSIFDQAAPGPVKVWRGTRYLAKRFRGYHSRPKVCSEIPKSWPFGKQTWQCEMMKTGKPSTSPFSFWLGTWMGNVHCKARFLAGNCGYNISQGQSTGQLTNRGPA